MRLEVQNLRKSYGGRPVLKDVSFTAGPGVTCVMGPSGAGKTTLLRILLGLEQPDSGKISDVKDCRWGVVFQEDRLLEDLDAAGNLRLILGRDDDGISACLAALGLDDVGRKAVRDYSGGMKRRLALARALLAPSDALALDEPFAGLDGAARAQAIACIRQYGAGKPVLLVTHNPEDPAALDACGFLHL